MSQPDRPEQSPATVVSRDDVTDHRALIARIDGTMAALARERQRLEERAAQSEPPATGGGIDRAR